MIKLLAAVSFVFAMFEFENIVFQAIWSYGWLIVLFVCGKKLGVFDHE